MGEKLKWKVLRRHDGDRMYEEGDTREGTKAELGHLSPHVLELIGPVEEPVTAQAEPAPENQAEPPLANKAARSRKAKAK